MRYCWSRYRYIRGGGRSPKVVEAASVCKLQVGCHQDRQRCADRLVWAAVAMESADELSVVDVLLRARGVFSYLKRLGDEDCAALTAHTFGKHIRRLRNDGAPAHQTRTRPQAPRRANPSQCAAAS
jgi:hypothetical protein